MAEIPGAGKLPQFKKLVGNLQPVMRNPGKLFYNYPDDIWSRQVFILFLYLIVSLLNQ
jgi:hypothetical protein